MYVMIFCVGRGGYGFRRQNNNDDDEIEILKEAIFIQNLPKNITRDDILEVFSTVGPIKVKSNDSFMTLGIMIIVDG